MDETEVDDELPSRLGFSQILIPHGGPFSVLFLLFKTTLTPRLCL